MLFQVEGPLTGIPWFYAVFYGGQTLLILIALIYFAIKAMPTWKEIRMKELDVSKQMAEALGSNATALQQVSGTLHSVAVEQRKATEIIEILQRANSDSEQQLSYAVRGLSERMESMELNCAASGHLGK